MNVESAAVPTLQKNVLPRLHDSRRCHWRPHSDFCLYCARRVVPPRTVSKYAGLERHLKFRAAFTSLVNLSFAQIDGLIGSNLPMDAYKDIAWWSNKSSSIHAKSWLNAGWEVQEVNLKEGQVTFKKVRNVAVKKSKGKKLEIIQPFKPVPVHRPKSKIPSNTKVSKALRPNQEPRTPTCHASSASHGFKVQVVAIPEATLQKRRKTTIAT